jgi:hypothetical protein
MPGPKPSEAAARLPQIALASAPEVDAFFQQRKKQHYLSWFNQALADRPPWARVRLVDTPQNHLGFHHFWNRIPQVFGAPISLVQFVSLMSIIANEQRGDFVPRTEKMGVAGHPGMAYLFDKIEGKKRSYNTLRGNQTALRCFNSASYLAAHGTLPQADRLTRTTDQRWAGEVWPEGIPTTPDPAVTGFIREADFMKFRGRGFIQTTGRANYLPLIRFVQSYTGGNATLDFYRSRWKDRPPNRVAFESNNADWDTLFQQTELILAAEAIRLHNHGSGGYLALSTDPATLDGTGAGSVHFMGLKISGSESYASLFQERVAAVLAAI